MGRCPEEVGSLMMAGNIKLRFKWNQKAGVTTGYETVISVNKSKKDFGSQVIEQGI